MTIPSKPGTEFHGFLYAPIGEESNGMPLSVLSALARLDMDPWEMAGQLTDLPRDTSVPLLASMLERLPAGPSGRSAAVKLATHLVALLPLPYCLPQPAQAPAERSAKETRPPSTLLASVQLLVAFMLFFLISQSILAGLTAPADGNQHAASAVSALKGG